MLGQLVTAVQPGWASRISSSMDAARTLTPDPGVCRRGGGSALSHQRREGPSCALRSCPCSTEWHLAISLRLTNTEHEVPFLGPESTPSLALREVTFCWGVTSVTAGWGWGTL